MLKLGIVTSALVLVVGASAASAQDYPDPANGQVVASGWDNGPAANKQWPPYDQRDQYYRPGGALYGYGYGYDANVPAANKQWTPPPASAQVAPNGYAWNDSPRPNQQWPAPQPNMPRYGYGYGYGGNDGPAPNQQYPAPAPNMPDE